HVAVPHGVGKELYGTFPVFKETIDRCDQLFSTLVSGKPLTDALFGDATLYSQPVYLHAAIFAVEVALAKLWLSLGIRPEMVIGHSLGECAAAVVSGVMPLEAAMNFVVTRARVLHDLADDYCMIAVRTGSTTAEKLIEGMADASIAAI